MIELRIFCEGSTEVNFARDVLKPHLRRHNVFLKDPIDLKGIKPFATIKPRIAGILGQRRAHHFLTTMFDLYALPDFPGDPGSSRPGSLRAEAIEQAMYAHYPNPGFIPYIQVYEFEALVFVDLDQLTAQFPDGEAKGAPERLQRARAGKAPEDINDGPATAPSQRLAREIPTYGDLKPLAGPQIAARIGLHRLRDACPHFNAWLNRLEGLAAAL